jgi:hypothetical protein
MTEIVDSGDCRGSDICRLQHGISAAARGRGGYFLPIFQLIVVIEQNDEWLVCRRYLSEESLTLVLEDQGEEGEEVVAELGAG